MTPLLIRLDRQDERILHALVLHRRVFLDRCFSVLTRLGDPIVAIGIAAILAIGIFPSLAQAGREAAFALAFSHLLVQLVKRSVTRPRPRLPVGINSLIQPPDRFSFPSGHAAATVSIAMPLAATLPLPLGSVLVLLAALVGLSRCYLGVHYPGDVCAGWLLAVLASLLAPLALAWTTLAG